MGGISHHFATMQSQGDPAAGMSSRSMDGRRIHTSSDIGGMRRQAEGRNSLQHSYDAPSGRSPHSMRRSTDAGMARSIPSPFEPSLHPGHFQQSPGEYSSPFAFPGERPSVGIPPSLWMSPASTAPSTPGGLPSSYDQLHIHEAVPSSFSSYGQSPSPPFASDAKSTAFTDMFKDEMFGGPLPDPSARSPAFASPRRSGSPDLQALGVGVDDDPEKMAKEDPLATQVWKMYARTKATLPHAQRMENLTWRMMALALKKKKEDEAKAADDSSKAAVAAVLSKSPPTASASANATATTSNNSTPPPQEDDDDERGRRIDKGKGRVRVVGFEGTNQDGTDDADEE